jgi:hypothetical protein
VTDFRALLVQEPCWDTERPFVGGANAQVPGDCILQDREELILFCEWIERRRIRSYLEIGIWTGRLIAALHRIFCFDRVAACDPGLAVGFGLPLHLPPDAEVLWDRSDSPAYQSWRTTLGAIDLVFIDGDHSAAGVRRDYEINRASPHRFLAFHDIAGTNPATEGVRQLWHELDGFKLEIVRQYADHGLPDDATSGIGIWSATEQP